MADLWLPTWLKCAKVGFRYLERTGVSRGTFGGSPKTAALGGDRYGMRLEFTPNATSSTESARERRALIALLRRLRGKQNRLHAANPARVRAGSFPATELLANPTFTDATGWTTASHYTLAVAERRAKLTRNQVNGQADSLRSSTAASMTLYYPHVARLMRIDGRVSGSTYFLRVGSGIGGNEYYSSPSALAAGLATAVFVPHGASGYITLRDASTTGVTPGDFVEVPYVSISRCALVDNGANLLLQSDDFTTTWTNTRSTDAANSTAAPDGTTTADSIIEDATASSTHYIEQGVTVAATANLDYALSVALKAGTRSFAQIIMEESTSGHDCRVNVNLSTGAIDTPSVTGANWDNPRAFSRDLGNGWWVVTVIGRKVSVGTTLTARIALATALGTISYSGDGASLIYAWRATLAQSSVPTRLVQTTTTALPTGTAQALGGGLHIKGLPVSTNDLLMQDDEYQIGNEFHACDTSLNSDAAGLGFLIGNPPMRSAPADNAPVIIHEPMGYFMFSGDAVGWDHEPGILTNASADFEEA